MGEEFAGELGFATEAVDDPRLGRMPLFFQGYYFREGFDYVEDEGFAECFAEGVVEVEECCLGFDYFGAGGGDGSLDCTAGIAEGVEATFADGEDLGFGSEGTEEAEGGGGDAEVVPGVYAD